MYELRLARAARKELDALPDAVLGRIARVLDALPEEPRPRGCKKLRGTADLWRVRIGDYRIIYHIDDGEQLISVRAVGNRKDVYG